jgi:DMSO/TMAO reductase YedYZ molybdopterin-dependent catalytic subunit
MAVVLGRLLGSAFVICFFTGLYSHFIQNPLPWMVFPTFSPNLYAITQGVHIAAGIACFPLILGKLYTIYPRLFVYPPITGFVNLLERASIALFVAASLVEIVIGMINTADWYPFPFPFRQTHFALAFVIIGSLAIHIGVKLPLITKYWTKKGSYDADGVLLPPDDDEEPGIDRDSVIPEHEGIPEKLPEPVKVAAETARGVTGRILAWIDATPNALVTPPRELPESGMTAVPAPASDAPATARTARTSRRGFLVTIFASLAGVVAFWSGQSFRPLAPLNLIAPRAQGDGPNDLPINRTSKMAQITADLVGENYRLLIKRGSEVKSFTYAQLLAMPQHIVQLPIACVNGWSQTATWKGIQLNTLMDEVGRKPGEAIMLTSLEVSGNYRVTTMGPEFVENDLTLVALHLNGQVLDIEHGYPARMIAPARPGVLQTKWLSTLEVTT